MCCAPPTPFFTNNNNSFYQTNQPPKQITQYAWLWKRGMHVRRLRMRVRSLLVRKMYVTPLELSQPAAGLCSDDELMSCRNAS